MKEKVNRSIYSFSESSSQKFVASYLDKIIWALIIFLIIFTIIKVKHLSLYGVIALIFLCIIPYLYGKIQGKFSYKITVDFASRKIMLHMHRSSSIITADFDSIKSIRLNGYIIFVLKDKKVFYNDLENVELLNCLNKIMKIQWGFLCAILGPSKEVREKLGKNRDTH